VLPGLTAAAVEGRAALGERAGQRDGRVGRDGRWEPLVKGPLCAELEGFSLHAGAWLQARGEVAALPSLEAGARSATRYAAALVAAAALGMRGQGRAPRRQDATTLRRVMAAA
jgi:hypothetical protein